MNDWLQIETGYVRAREVVAVTVEESSYEQERPSKGTTETRYYAAVVLTLRGGGRLYVRETFDLATAQKEVERLRAGIEAIVDGIENGVLR